jgi:hypothetical protein
LQAETAMEAAIRSQRREVAWGFLPVRPTRQNGPILSKSGSDLGPVSRVKEFLRGSRTGCQYR